jgi:hypothetical protein
VKQFKFLGFLTLFLPDFHRKGQKGADFLIVIFFTFFDNDRVE